MANHVHKMRELCEIKSSKRIFAADYKPEGVPFYRGKEISEKFRGNLDVSTELFIDREKFEKIRIKFGAPVAGDLLLTSVGTLGSPYVVNEGEEFYFKDGNLTWFRNFKHLDSWFLYYWLQSPEGKAEQKKCTIGSSQSAYTIVLLKEMEISLPPLITQRKIATILSAYDDLIENNLRRIKILEEMAQNLYREWFVKFRFPGHQQAHFTNSPLGPIPEGWEATTIGNVTSYISRGLSPRYDDSSSSVVINQKCIRGHKLDLGFARRHSSRIAPEKYLHFGDILINSTGIGTLGRVAQVYTALSDTTVDTHVSIVRPQSSEDIDYLGLALMDMESHFDLLGAGATGQTELRKDRISETEIILPPLDLRNGFSSMVAPIRRLGISLLAKNTTLRRTRDLLLPRLISGEVDVSELDITVPDVAEA